MLTIDLCLDVLGLESDCNLEDIKKRYRELAKKWHPDLGGCQEKMQILNQAYEMLMENFDSIKTFHRASGFTSWIDEMLVVLNKLDGVIIELVGSWFWLEGKTYEHKERLKEIGFKWSGSKKKWYCFQDCDQNSKKPRYGTTFDKIVEKYGKKTFHTQGKTCLNA